MRPAPRVVLGMPAYNRPDALPRALESLLAQTFTDFAIVIADDGGSLAARNVIESYAAGDSRLIYEANGQRLGMIENWRRAFTRSRERFPQSDYFAWASDHDAWHPRFLEVLVAALDDAPGAVLAYPRAVHLWPDEPRRAALPIDTQGLSRRSRLAAAAEIAAGDCIYGLFRAPALLQAGVFRPVLMPDRQILMELSLLGEFRSVPEQLWYREVAGGFSYARQRRMFFAGRVPLHIYLPVSLQHFGVLFWDVVLRGRSRPLVGRVAGLGDALLQLWASVRRDLRRLRAAARRLRRRPMRASVAAVESH
jgi:glycosyltransferase involved in cell wall biosynthesis